MLQKTAKLFCAVWIFTPQTIRKLYRQ